jgi:hypothetical protein
MKWTDWKTKTVAVTGDEIELEYRDATLPMTEWEPAEYYIEYKKLLVNGEEIEYDIEGILDALLDEYELEQMFQNATFDP